MHAVELVHETPVSVVDAVPFGLGTD